MTNNDNEFCHDLNYSHNVKLALLAIMQMRTAQKNLVHIERLCANQEKIVSFDAKLTLHPVNINKEMNHVLKQMYIYRMMQKSEDFKTAYLGNLKQDAGKIK